MIKTAEYLGIEELRKRLNCKRPRVNKRYAFYDMKHSAPDLQISTPKGLECLKSCVGWCGKAVDSIADRLTFNTFSNDVFNMAEIYNQNNADILIPSANLSALISSCCFIYISEDENGFARMQVIDGGNATGVMNPITFLLDEGYAVLERDKNGNPIIEAYFTSESTDIYREGKLTEIYDNPTGISLLVPYVYKPDAKRPFGHSRISRACMSITDSALRTIKRSEISAEFYSVPQKYVLGTHPDAEKLDKWRASMSSLLEITKDEDGDKPTVGQFQQQSMTPHLEQLRMFASLFAGETGLTLDDLGFPSANPSSSEAITASHEVLRMTAEKAASWFGVCLVNAGYVARCLTDKQPYKRKQVYITKAEWEPLFALGASQLSGLGDAIIKIQQAFPDYFTEEKLHSLTGV